MNKLVKSFGFLGVVLLAAMTLSACGTTGGPHNGPTVGGSYMVVHYNGLSNVQGSVAATWTPTQYRQLAELDQVCKTQLGPQTPGMLGGVLKEGALYALGDGIGLAAGAKGAFGKAVSALKYGIYGALSGAGNGAAYGIDRYDMAKKYAQGACMYLQVYWAQSQDGQLMGVGTIPWVGPTNAKGVAMPSGDPSATTTAVTGNRKTNPNLPPPPPN